MGHHRRQPVPIPNVQMPIIWLCYGNGRYRRAAADATRGRNLAVHDPLSSIPIFSPKSPRYTRPDAYTRSTRSTRHRRRNRIRTCHRADRVSYHVEYALSDFKGPVVVRVFKHTNSKTLHRPHRHVRSPSARGRRPQKGTFRCSIPTTDDRRPTRSGVAKARDHARDFDSTRLQPRLPSTAMNVRSRAPSASCIRCVSIRAHTGRVGCPRASSSSRPLFPQNLKFRLV